MAAVYPAGPDPMIRHLTCSGVVLMGAKIIRGKEGNGGRNQEKGIRKKEKGGRKEG
jgi:hypothetical protein